MNTLRVSVVLFALAIAASFAEETNTLPTIIQVGGLTYSNVTWGAVTPSTVTIFHKTGIASIPLEKLPAELQKRFGYDANKASQWRDAEQKTHAALAEQKRQEEERKRKEKEEETQPLTGKDLTAWKLARQSAEHTLQRMLSPGGTAHWDFSDSPPLKKYMRKNAIGDYEFLFKGHGVNYNINGEGLVREGSVVVTVTEMGNQLRVVPAKGDKPW